MAKTISTANAILSFIDKLAPKADARIMATVIAESYSLSEGSPEFYFLLHAQSDNFSRLLAQIELAEIGQPAKKNFLKQTKSLAEITSYKSLALRFDHIKKDFITPNRLMLTYIDDSLKQTIVIDDALEKQLSECAVQLQSTLDELLQSDIPAKLKGYLKIQITRLVLMLQNLESFSSDQIWEQASATHAKLYATAPHIKDAKGQRVYAALAAVMGGIMATLMYVEAALDKSIAIGRHLKEGQELIEQWRPKLSPPIDDASETIPH